MTRPLSPTVYTEGLGEALRAHRLYIGLSQKDMAERMGKDRRDYARIEANRAACPPGLLSRIEELSDAFAQQVDAVLDQAEKTPGGITVAVVVNSGQPWDEWYRLVAGRAMVETDASAPITLTIVGEHDERIAG